jgi:AdoMet-dependent heme synthase
MISLRSYTKRPSPTFLVLFINSICNMKCEHCFYWTSLNKKDDMSFDELKKLSDSLGTLENLNLSGGEPFLRKDFAEVCRLFIKKNKVRQIYVPSNGYFTEKTVKAVRELLEEKDFDLFVVELSLDGMPEFHDTFRVAKNSFRKAMQTYEALIEIQKEDPRLRVHCISTATDVNMAEIRELSTYLYERCPDMDHHNLAIIRGERKNPELASPLIAEYEALYTYIKKLWAPREEGRYGGIVEPMLQWAKVQTVKEQRQVVPCTAGRVTAVVYANGDVSACEMHDPIGNLRNNTFSEIWDSAPLEELRDSIHKKECHCTTEVFLWPSIVFQPPSLARAMVGAKVWESPGRLDPSEHIAIDLDEDLMPVSSAPSMAESVESEE